MTMTTSEQIMSWSDCLKTKGNEHKVTRIYNPLAICIH